MEILNKEVANFINLREANRLSWEDIHGLATKAGNDYVIHSMFILDNELILFLLGKMRIYIF
jgi:hypothetical protein